MKNKCLIFNNYEFRKTDGGPSGFLAQNFSCSAGEYFELGNKKDSYPLNSRAGLNSIALKLKLKLNVVLNHLDKKHYAEQIRSSRISFAYNKAKEYRAVWFHDIFQCYACLDLIKPDQIVILQSHSPQLVSEEVYDYSGNKLIAEWVKQAEIAAFNRANYLVFPNAGVTELYEKIIKDESKLIYLPSGCEKKSKQIPIPLDEKFTYFLYIGRRNKIKGYDVLIEAFDEACKVRKDIKLIVAGQGDKSSKNDSIIDIGYTNNPHLWLSTCDYLINANRQSYFDLSVMEALSMGTPLILTCSHGHTFFKNQHSKGITEVIANNAASLTSAIIKSKLKKDNNIEGSLQNVQLFDQNFTSDLYLARIENFLSNVLS